MVDAAAWPDRPARELGRALAGLAQQAALALRAVWRLAGLQGRSGLALLAVGGFGRGRLFPFSDVDVLVLCAPQAGAAADEAVRAFVAACWDVGLPISSSVRTPDQALAAAREDLSLCTALLEARFVAGDAALCARFEQAFAVQLDALAFVKAKRLEQR